MQQGWQQGRKDDAVSISEGITNHISSQEILQSWQVLQHPLKYIKIDNDIKLKKLFLYIVRITHSTLASLFDYEKHMKMKEMESLKPQHTLLVPPRTNC